MNNFFYFFTAHNFFFFKTDCYCLKDYFFFGQYFFCYPVLFINYSPDFFINKSGSGFTEISYDHKIQLDLPAFWLTVSA